MTEPSTCGMIPDSVNRQPVIVLNACDRDCQMELKKLDWIYELGACKGFDCLVVHDRTMNRILSEEIFAAARKNFHTVKVHSYDPPSQTRWPLAANWAFQQAAWVMYEDGRCWYWMETDCVPLREHWLEDIAAEYWACGKPIMGSQVTGRGHFNGTAIYPSNFPDLSPTAMRSTTDAWDWEMTGEIRHLAHDSKLMFHCWGIVNGNTHPYEGQAAVFNTQDQLERWVPKGAATFHRAKDGSLIDRLRERRQAAKPALANAGGASLKL